MWAHCGGQVVSAGPPVLLLTQRDAKESVLVVLLSELAGHFMRRSFSRESACQTDTDKASWSSLLGASALHGWACDGLSLAWSLAQLTNCHSWMASPPAPSSLLEVATSRWMSS